MALQSTRAAQSEGFPMADLIYLVAGLAFFAVMAAYAAACARL